MKKVKMFLEFVNSNKISKHIDMTYDEIMAYLPEEDKVKLERIKRLGWESVGSPIVSALADMSANCGILAPHRIKLDNSNAIISTNALELGSTPTYLGRSTDFDSNSTSKWYTGSVAKIDISELSGSTPISYSDPLYVNNTSQISGPNCSKATMSLDVYDSNIYTITWEQLLSATTKISIGVQVYDSNLNLVAKGSSAVWENLSVTSTVYQTLSKKSAIAVDSRSIYVGYEDTIKVYNSRFERCSGISSLSLKSTLSITHDELQPSTNSEILDYIRSK
jgi:hypothetical protein